MNLDGLNKVIDDLISGGGVGVELSMNLWKFGVGEVRVDVEGCGL